MAAVAKTPQEQIVLDFFRILSSGELEAIRKTLHADAEWRPMVDNIPGAGVHGGEVVAQGTPEQVRRNPASLTGRYLAHKLQIAGLSTGHDQAVLRGDPASGAFSVFCFKEGRLLAVRASAPCTARTVRDSSRSRSSSRTCCTTARAAALLESGLDAQAAAAQTPHRSYPGNVPSNLIWLPSLTPHTLGALMALYEHKVFCQAAIWDINPFDQWGVELGKRMAQALQNQTHP